MQNIPIDPSVHRHRKSELETQISKVSDSIQNSRMKFMQPHIVPTVIRNDPRVNSAVNQQNINR